MGRFPVAFAAVLAWKLVGCVDYGSLDPVGLRDVGDAEHDRPDADGVSVDNCCEMGGGCDEDCRPLQCTSAEDCATSDTPVLPPDACCGCGAVCESGRCSVLCVDSPCCRSGQGCGPHCNTVCGDHSDCGEEMRCLEGVCVDDPPHCGEEPDPGCYRGVELDTCKAYGGTWICAPAGMCWCDCPTGDLGCPCWKLGHCISACVSVYDPDHCDEVKMGTCHGTTGLPLGCYCLLSRNYVGFLGVCLDGPGFVSRRPARSH